MYNYCATVLTEDAAVVACLRGLAVHRNGHSAVAGATNAKWRQEGHMVTLRFRSEQSREEFLHDVDRLMPEGMCAHETFEEARAVPNAAA